jgi:hypothetical protein
VAACVDRRAERGTIGEGSRRAGLLASAAGAASGDVGADPSTGESDEHDSGQAQHLLGAGAADRRGSGGAHRPGGDRGVVRAAAGAAAGAVAWPGQTSRGLSPRDRLAGAQTRRLRPLCVSRRSVSDDDLPAGLRCVAGGAARTRGQGVRASVAPGEPGRGGGRGEGAGGVADQRRSGERAGGGSAAGQTGAVSAGGLGGRCGGGLATV